MRAYLFAYGTLRKNFDLELKKKIGQELEWLGRGKIGASLYDLGAYPGAVKNKAGKAIGRPGQEVIGDLYLMHHPEKLLKVLDAYEGYSEKAGVLSEFVRKRSRVLLVSGKKVSAWIYWYNLDPRDKPRIRYKDYLNYLKYKRPI